MTTIDSISRGTLRSLHVRNFRLFVTGQLVSQTGNFMTLLAQNLLVLELTDSGVAVGLMVCCQFLPILLFASVGGIVADRHDKLTVLRTAQFLAMIQSFVLAGVAFLDHPPLAAFYVLAFAGGLTMALDNPTRRSFVVELVPPDHMQNAVVLNTAVQTSARIFGPALAGLVITTWGYPWAFLIDGVSYIGVLIALGLVRRRDMFRPPVAVRGRGQIREGFRYMWSVPDIRIPMIITAATGLLALNLTVTLPLFVTRSLDGSDAGFTVLYSVLSAGALAAALVTASRRRITIGQVTTSTAMLGGSLVLMAATPSLPAALGVALLVGYASTWFFASSTTIVQLSAAPDMRGRVLALQAMVILGMTPIGGPLVGWICEVANARVGLVISGATAVATAVWGQAAFRKARFGERSLTNV